MDGERPGPNRAAARSGAVRLRPVLYDSTYDFVYVVPLLEFSAGLLSGVDVGF